MRQVFFRLGEVILELIGQIDAAGEGDPGLLRPRHHRRRPRRAGALLGEHLGHAKDAVQEGRRIATLRHREVGMSVATAFMSPEPHRRRRSRRRRCRRGTGAIASASHARPRLHRCHRCAARHLREGVPRAPGVRGAVPGRRPPRRHDLGDLLRPPGRGAAAAGPGRHHLRLADLGPDRLPVLVHRRALRRGAAHRDRDRDADPAARRRCPT